jgi:Ser/Thr protein kinase RdoA (MazF antagonist)
LEAYGLGDGELRLVQYNENVIYRVIAPERQSESEVGESFIPGQYALRIHAMRDRAAITSEMQWLEALAAHGFSLAPAPVRSGAGELSISVAADIFPEGRVVTLLRWVKGRKLEKGLRPVHLKRLGRTVAHLHQFSRTWKAPPGFSRPRWDWHSQLGGEMFEVSLEELIASMPDRVRKPFQTVSTEARSAMAQLGESSDVSGLIHSDIYPENVLFDGGRASLVDFEDCGFGYWIWDIAVALCTWAWQPGWEEMREAFISGYSEVRTLPADQRALLDLFIAAQYATMLLWATAFIHHDPIRIDEYEPWRDDSANRLLGYFAR